MFPPKRSLKHSCVCIDTSRTSGRKISKSCSFETCSLVGGDAEAVLGVAAWDSLDNSEKCVLSLREVMSSSDESSELDVDDAELLQLLDTIRSLGAGRNLNRMDEIFSSSAVPGGLDFCG